MAKWQISESGAGLALDPQGRGEVTFTVTNASTAADRAVLTVHPLDGAADGWFTVTEPMRPVAAGASVVFPVDVAVPSSVAAGAYGVQGVAYSADTDPSETSATSKRVSLTVGAASAPAGGGLPWWVFAAGGAAVLLVVAVLAVILLGGDDDSAATSTEAPTSTAGAGAGPGGLPIDPGSIGSIILPPFGTSPDVIEVPDTVGETQERAVELLSPDFDVRVDVDCSVSLFAPQAPVVAQIPRTGKHERGTEVVIVTRPTIFGLPCP
jgi:hypothetical protein